ncbi:MAG: PP2C family protein-serine/threonine phosphatase, partial [Desulfohalobiaceae bacterium]
TALVGVVEVGASFESLILNLREAFAEFGKEVQLAVLLRRSHLDRTLWPDKLLGREILHIAGQDYVVESSTSDMIRMIARSAFLDPLVSGLPGVEVVEFDRSPYEVVALEIPMREAGGREDTAPAPNGEAPAGLLVAWHPVEGAAGLKLQSLKRNIASGLAAYGVIMAAVGLAWIYGSRHLRNLVRRRTAELAEANTELKRAERSYRGIYDSAIQGMFQSSLDGSYFSLNPAFVHMLGYDFPGEVNKITNPAMQMFLGCENGTQLMEKLLHQREIQNHEAELSRKDGSTVYVLGNVWLNQDESGTTYIEGIVVDHTARRLIEEKLKEEQRRLNQDLRTAAEVQLSLLPGDVPESECFHAEWRFMPSFQVSGDILNIFELDCEHLAFYVLDVSGHGVPSSLVGASASQALQPYSYFCSWSPEGPGSNKCNHPPKVVLELLNMEFPFERFDRFLTICYMVLNLRTGVLSYCNAGHPEACVLRAGGQLEILPVKNTIIGIDRSLNFEQGSVNLAPGDKIFVYTDGVIDHRSQKGEFYGEERLMDYLRQHATVPSSDLLDNLTAELMRFGDNAEPRDDITLLAVEFLKPFQGENLLRAFPQGGKPSGK